MTEAGAGGMDAGVYRCRRATLATGDVDEASFDHDLGACEACLGGLSTREWLEAHDYEMPTCEHLGTGYTLCVWMEKTGNWPRTKPVVHSINMAGAARIRAIIERAYTSRRT